MSTITRARTRATRLSAINIHNDVIYMAGQTGSPEGDVQTQAKVMLGKVDDLLKEAGSDKSHILQALIYLSDMQADFAAFNEIWDAWVPEGQAPARACVEAALAGPELLCEVVITAVKIK